MKEQNSANSGFQGWWAVFLFAALGVTGLQAASGTRSNAVEVSAAVYPDPARIDFSWTADATAPEYQVFKKLPETGWTLIAILDGSATSFSDADVQPGIVHEYSFRKVPASISATLSLADGGGNELTFTIYDAWGDGMCCSHGLGQYQVAGCGVTFASGGAFRAQESTTFSLDPETCTEVTVSLVFDYYGNETSWRIFDPQVAVPIAQGGPYSVPRFGNIASGIEVPALPYRGTVLLLVEQGVAQALGQELERLKLDLIGDGYRVSRHEVAADEAVTAVKEVILSAHRQDPEIATLFLLGHVPVPYSGNVSSAHSDHTGAWPADVYYGELDGEWTDNSVDNTSATRSANHNVPGDGKFDQTFLPSSVDLSVGRVDLSRMPAFSQTESELLRRYLDKNHAFRSGQTQINRRALIHDAVGSLDGFAPAATGWRNFSTMFGPTGVEAGTFYPGLETQSYLWCYGCAGSSYTSCGGIVSTSQLATTAMRAVFTVLYGSYFGDWDNENNMLRAPLAAEGDALTCFWAGHPAWHFQHMALGYPIGYCARMTQNNINEYLPGDGSRQVHIALMGDPTLRMHVVEPITDLTAERLSGGEVRLAWSAAENPVAGYHVYRSPGLDEGFVEIAETIATTHDDPVPLVGGSFYMVRARKLETSASGSYYNLSSGVITAGPDGPRPRRPGPRPTKAH